MKLWHHTLASFPRIFEKNIFNKCCAQDEYATNPKIFYTFEVSSQSTICGQVGSWCSKNRHTLVYKKPPLWIFFSKWCTRAQGWNITFFLLGLDSANMQQIKKIVVVLKPTQLVLHVVKWAPNFPKIVAV